VASPYGRQGAGVRRRTAARQSRHHRRCKTVPAAEAEATVAAAATDAEKVGGAPVWEGVNPVAFGAACEGRRADRLEPQEGAPAKVSSALDCTILSSSLA